MPKIRVGLQIEDTSPSVRHLIGSGKGVSEWDGVDPDEIVKVTYLSSSADIQEINPGIYYNIPSITTAKQGDTLFSDDGRLFVYDEAGSRWFLWYTFDNSTIKIHTNNTLTGDGSLNHPLSVNTTLFSLKGDLNPLLKGVDNGDGTYTFTSVDGSTMFTVDVGDNFVTHIDELRLTEVPKDNTRIDVIGYYLDTPGKGGGRFYWDANSVEPDNGGTVIEPYSVSTDGKPCLSFDGVDDYVQARNSSDLNFALPIKVKFTHLTTDTYRPIAKSEAGDSPNRYWLTYTGGSFGLRTTNKDYVAPVNFTIGQTYEYEVYLDGGDIVQKIDGVEYSRTAAGSLPISSSYTFRLAAYETIGGQPTTWTENKIHSFQIGTETFPMNEGTGTTITGSEGTILDINGATWGRSGRWKRFHDGNVDAYWFGLRGEGTGDETTKLQFFFDHIGNTNYRSAVIEGSYLISDTINIGFPSGDPYRTKVIHGSPSFNAASAMEVMLHFVNNTSLQVSGVWRVTGATSRVYSARTPYGSGVHINNCGRSNFGGFIGLGFRDSVVAVLGGNSSVSSIGTVSSTNVGTGAPGNSWTNSLTANWSNKVDTGAPTSTNQRSTIEVDVMPDYSYRGIQLCYIEGEYYEIRSKDEINSTISVYPIIPSEYISGTLVYHYGAAVYLAGSDTNVLQIGTIDAVRTGTGVDMSSLYGPNVDRMVIQNCGTAFIVGREGNAAMVSYNINQFYSENNLSEFIYLVRTSIGNHNVNTIYDYDPNKIKFVSRHSRWDKTTSLMLNNGGRLLTYEKAPHNGLGTGGSATVNLDGPNKVITLSRNDVNISLNPNLQWNRMFGYDTAWVAVRGSGPNNSPTGVISFRSQRSDSTYRDINGVNSSTPIEYQGSNFPGPALFVCYYRVATDDFMVDPVARIPTPAEIGALGVGDKAADSDLLDGLDSTNFATAAQGSLADTAIQPGDDITELNNNGVYLNEASHDALPADNPHSVNIQQTYDEGSPASTSTPDNVLTTEAGVVKTTPILNYNVFNQNIRNSVNVVGTTETTILSLTTGSLSLTANDCAANNSYELEITGELTWGGTTTGVNIILYVGTQAETISIPLSGTGAEPIKIEAKLDFLDGIDTARTCIFTGNVIHIDDTGTTVYIPIPETELTVDVSSGTTFDATFTGTDAIDEITISKAMLNRVVS